jgi:hypothetical protein
MKINEIFDAINRQHLAADQRRRAKVEAEWKQFGEIQDKDLLFCIGFSSQEFVDELLAAHPARRLADSVENLKIAFDILTRSRAAFVDIAGRFHARVVHDLHEGNDRKPTLSEATYSCAAISLVQAYRHMISQRPEAREIYEQLRAEVFSDPKILRFFSDLRNSNNHVHILVASPHYTITSRFNGKPEVKSGISFNRNAISRDQGWSAESESLLKTRENLEVIDLIDEHFKLAARFKDTVLFRTGIHSDKGYRDYMRIFQARKVIGERVSLGLVLQIAVPKKLNPYEYLDHYFTEDELKNIYSFEDHTKEQLEYMITLRDPFGFCDRHTREELYKLFSVPLDLLPDQIPEKPRIDF